MIIDICAPIYCLENLNRENRLTRKHGKQVEEGLEGWEVKIN